MEGGPIEGGATCNMEVLVSIFSLFLLLLSADSETSDDEKKLPKPKANDFVRLVSSNSSMNGIALWSFYARCTVNVHVCVLLPSYL